MWDNVNYTSDSTQGAIIQHPHLRRLTERRLLLKIMCFRRRTLSIFVFQLPPPRSAGRCKLEREWNWLSCDGGKFGIGIRLLRMQAECLRGKAEELGIEIPKLQAHCLHCNISLKRGTFCRFLCSHVAQYAGGSERNSIIPIRFNEANAKQIAET